MNSSRFLDPPEFAVIHDKGNEENVFDRVDYNFDQANSVHLDLNYSRSWFQTPNAYDNIGVENVTAFGTSASPTFSNVGDTDQHSKIGTFNISPTLYARHQQLLGLQPGRVRPQGYLQLLPQRQSACRPGPFEPADLVDFTDPFAHERRCSL